MASGGFRLGLGLVTLLLAAHELCLRFALASLGFLELRHQLEVLKVDRTQAKIAIGECLGQFVYGLGETQVVGLDEPDFFFWRGWGFAVVEDAPVVVGGLLVLTVIRRHGAFVRGRHFFLLNGSSKIDTR